MWRRQIAHLEGAGTTLSLMTAEIKRIAISLDEYLLDDIGVLKVL